MNASTEGNNTHGNTVPTPESKETDHVEPPATKKDPWAAARGAPSQDWQPQSWTPKPSQR